MAEEYLKEITLPSGGNFYEKQIPDGLLSIEPMGTREEKLFASGKSGGAVIDKIFDACVASPLPHQKLVLGDRLFLLLQIRTVSYGDEYTYPFQCRQCGHKGHGVVNLSEIPIKRPTDGASEHFSLTLPILGNDLKLRLLTGEDEDKVRRYSKQLEARSQGGTNNAEYIYRLARRIVEIDGEDVGIREAMEFVEKLKGKDSLHLRDEIDDADVGPDLDVEPECENARCGYIQEPFSMPIESEFFRPRRRRSRSGDHITTAVAVDDIG